MKMDRNDLERFRRHAGKSKAYKLTTADGEESEFIFKPLGAQHLPELMYIASVLDHTPREKQELKKLRQQVRRGEKTQEDLEELFDLYDDNAMQRLLRKENSEVLIGLIKTMVMESYPVLKEDLDLLNQFVMANLNDLQTALMELNQHKSADKAAEEKVLKRIEQMKKQRRGNA